MSGTTPRQDAPVGLIDLLAVLVRYRRLIAFTTAFVMSIAVVMLYVMPSLGLNAGYQSHFLAVARVQTHTMPTIVYPYLSSIPEPVAVTVANNAVQPVPTRAWLSPLLAAAAADPSVVATAWEAFTEHRADFAASDNGSDAQATLLREVSTRLNVDVDQGTGVVTVSYSAGRREDASDFVDALVAAAVDDASAPIGRSLAQTERAIGTAIDRSTAMIDRLIVQSQTIAGDASGALLDTTTVVSSTLTDLVALQNVRAVIDSLAQNPGILYSRVGATTVSQAVSWRGQPNSLARATVLGLAFFGTVFFTVFCAFVLEYIRRVKQQPAEMAKLKAAWRRS